MTISTDNNNRATWHLLRRNPVLTAMMVSSLVLGITALVAAFTMWRAISSCSLPRKTIFPYVVRVVEANAGRADALMEPRASRAP
jgi:hypothetical protein